MCGNGRENGGQVRFNFFGRNAGYPVACCLKQPLSLSVAFWLGLMGAAIDLDDETLPGRSRSLQ